MPKRVFLLFIIGLMLSSLLWSQDPVEEALTLDQCIAAALQQNPLILSSLDQYEASLARIHQAKAFPQPSLDYDSDLQPRLFNFKDSGESYFGLSQTVEFPGKRHLRGKIAARESEQILQDIDLLKLDLIFRIKQAFYGLLLAEEKLTYARQDLTLSQDFLHKTEVKYSAGAVARVELLRARVEASKAANEVRVAENEVRLAKAVMNFLLARRKYAPLQIKGELKRVPTPLKIEDLVDRALSFRPELKRIKFSIEREKLQKKQAWMSYLPDLDLGVSRHHFEGQESWWDVTLSFPIPLFFWQPKRGEIAEAESNIRSFQREAEHLKNTVILEVQEAHMNALTAQNQIKLFEEQILSQAEEVYNMFLFSYQEGEIGGIELIEARRTLMAARRSYADALFNYDIALAALERSIGQPFEGEEP